MLIGEDYPKIEFQAFGLDLVEPNAMLGDSIICAVALIIAYKIGKMPIQNTFFKSWKAFFIIFGIGFFFGGLGHMMYNYWGLPGKYASWYSGIFAAFFIERAMISIHSSEKFQSIFNKVISAKLVLALLGATAVFMFVDLEADPSLGLRVPTLNTTIGLLFALGYLGFKYAKAITPGFKYLWISIIILIPTAFLQTMKISFHQWFDRNDASHILLIIGLLMYFVSIKAYQQFLSSKN